MAGIDIRRIHIVAFNFAGVEIGPRVFVLSDWQGGFNEVKYVKDYRLGNGPPTPCFRREGDVVIKEIGNRNFSQI